MHGTLCALACETWLQRPALPRSHTHPHPRRSYARIAHPRSPGHTGNLRSDSAGSSALGRRPDVPSCTLRRPARVGADVEGMRASPGYSPPWRARTPHAAAMRLGSGMAIATAHSPLADAGRSFSRYGRCVHTPPPTERRTIGQQRTVSRPASTARLQAPLRFSQRRGNARWKGCAHSLRRLANVNGNPKRALGSAVTTPASNARIFRPCGLSGHPPLRGWPL